MVNFREQFERDFKTTRKLKKLTKEFANVKPEEFKSIAKRMARFK